MPNTPPRKPARQVPSGERIKQMLIPSMTGSMPGSDMERIPPASLQQAAMQNYPYNPSDYTPEELARYEEMLFRNRYGNPFPSRTDITGEGLIGPGGFGEGIRGDPIYARQDSIYTAQRLQDARALQRREMLNGLMQKLGGIFGEKNVRLER